MTLLSIAYTLIMVNRCYNIMRVIVSLHPLKLHLWPLVNCVLLCLLTVLCLGLDPAGLSTVCLAHPCSLVQTT